MRRFWGLLVLVAWAVGAPLPAEPLPSGLAIPSASDARQSGSGSKADALILTGEFDRVLASDGGGGSLDWVRANGRGRTCTAGIASFSINNSTWAFGKLGAALPLQPRVSVQGQASLGGGRAGGAGFGYWIFEGDLTYKPASRLYLKFGDQYFHVGAIRGNLLRSGALILPSRFVSVDLTYARSATGNLNTDFSSLRLDFAARHARFLAGGAVGRSAPALFNIGVGSRSIDQNLTDSFAGVGIPVSRLELIAVVEFLHIGALERRTLSLSLKIRINKPPVN